MLIFGKDHLIKFCVRTAMSENEYSAMIFVSAVHVLGAVYLFVMCWDLLDTIFKNRIVVN